MAAQGDAARSIYIFAQTKRININKPDKKGATPLHWACQSNSEMAITYLLSMKADFDVQDQQGFTPLHLAVQNSD